MKKRIIEKFLKWIDDVNLLEFFHFELNEEEREYLFPKMEKLNLNTVKYLKGEQNEKEDST